MKCAKHPEMTWDNKGDYVQHLRECQPQVLSRYDRIYESLSKELKLRLPEPTEPDYGALAEAWTEYAMTVENVTTPFGSQEPEHRVIPEEEYIDAEREIEHCSEMLSAEAKKLGIEFLNVPLRKWKSFSIFINALREIIEGFPLVNYATFNQAESGEVSNNQGDGCSALNNPFDPSFSKGVKEKSQVRGIESSVQALRD